MDQLGTCACKQIILPDFPRRQTRRMRYSRKNRLKSCYFSFFINICINIGPLSFRVPKYSTPFKESLLWHALLSRPQTTLLLTWWLNLSGHLSTIVSIFFASLDYHRHICVCRVSSSCSLYWHVKARYGNPYSEFAFNLSKLVRTH